MKKLRLELEELRVDTFEAGSHGERGTVRGAGLSEYPCETEPYWDSVNYCGPAGSGVNTCNNTCNYTCGCGTQGQWSCVWSVCTTSEPYVD